MDQRIKDLYDAYQHRRIGRRDFLRKLAVLLGSAAAADSIFNLLDNKGVSAEMIPSGRCPADRRND